MPLLLLVSLIWAFSPGLIKALSGGGIDGTFLSATRLGLAFLVFLPFLRLRGLAPRTALALAGIGAVQFGLMYLAYNESFRFLAAHEVAVLTLTTPIFVTLLADAFDRTLRVRALIAAFLAVLVIALFYTAQVHVGALMTAASKRANETVVVPTGTALRIIADACAGLHAAHGLKDAQGRWLKASVLLGEVHA